MDQTMLNELNWMPFNEWSTQKSFISCKYSKHFSAIIYEIMKRLEEIMWSICAIATPLEFHLYGVFGSVRSHTVRSLQWIVWNYEQKHNRKKLLFFFLFVNCSKNSMTWYYLKTAIQNRSLYFHLCATLVCTATEMEIETRPGILVTDIQKIPFS